MSTTPHGPEPDRPQADALEASPGPQGGDEAPTTPIESRATGAPAGGDLPPGPATVAGSTPAPEKQNRPGTNALIAGGAGLAVVATALGFGAGYITGDTTYQRSVHPAVWQQLGGGDGPSGFFDQDDRTGSRGPGMGGPGTGGPGMHGGPGMDGQREQPRMDRDQDDTGPGDQGQQSTPEQPSTGQAAV